MVREYNVVLKQPNGNCTWIEYGSQSEFERRKDDLQGEILRVGLSTRQARCFCDKQDISRRISEKEIIMGQTFYSF